MRYLNKFNEDESKSRSKILDLDYIDNCFVDFIDMPNSVLHSIDTKDVWYLDIFFPEFVSDTYSINDMSEVINHTEELLEFYKNIEDAVNKVKLQFPDITCGLNLTWEDHKGNYHRPISIAVSFRFIFRNALGYRI